MPSAEPTTDALVGIPVDEAADHARQVDAHQAAVAVLQRRTDRHHLLDLLVVELLCALHERIGREKEFARHEGRRENGYHEGGIPAERAGARHTEADSSHRGEIRVLSRTAHARSIWVQLAAV
eukprot:6834588-Prymnesium_polylepis.2